MRHITKSFGKIVSYIKLCYILINEKPIPLQSWYVEDVSSFQWLLRTEQGERRWEQKTGLIWKAQIVLSSHLSSLDLSTSILGIAQAFLSSGERFKSELQIWAVRRILGGLYSTWTSLYLYAKGDWNNKLIRSIYAACLSGGGKA